MRYQELLDEYMVLLDHDVRLRQEMHQIPKGYLVSKKIAGKEYLYLQFSHQGKKKSEYIHEQDVGRIRAAIARRDPVKAEMEAVRSEQHRLESAAKILDINLYRIFFFLKQSADMDALPIEKRQDALAFARAMTALEGLPAREETEDNLQLWASGQKKFADFYMKSLQSYHVLEGVQ